MITFKSRADLCQLSTTAPAYPVMDELIKLLIDDYTTPERPYLPDADGYQVLIEQGDVDRVLDLPELQCRLLDVPWEGASMRDGFFYAIYLANDEFGIGFLIPNLPWVKGELRDLLKELVAY